MEIGDGMLCYPVQKGCSYVAQWLALCAFLYSTSDRSSHLHLLATLHQPDRQLGETLTVFSMHMPLFGPTAKLFRTGRIVFLQPLLCCGAI